MCVFAQGYQFVSIQMFYGTVHRKIDYFDFSLVTDLIFIRLSLKISFSFFTSTVDYLFLFGPGNLTSFLFFIFFIPMIGSDGRTESLLWYLLTDCTDSPLL